MWEYIATHIAHSLLPALGIPGTLDLHQRSRACTHQKAKRPTQQITATTIPCLASFENEPTYTQQARPHIHHPVCHVRPWPEHFERLICLLTERQQREPEQSWLFLFAKNSGITAEGCNSRGGNQALRTLTTKKAPCSRGSERLALFDLIN